MHKIAILQHETTQGPGLLQRFLDEHALPYALIAPPLEGAPTRVGGYSAVVVLGSNHSANERLPWIQQELALLQEAVARQVPVLGHCFGAQMLARAMGAPVWRNPCAHIGWSRVGVTPAAQQLMQLEPQALLFHWHYDSFGIPRGAQRSMYSRHCLNKGFVRGPHWGFQGHLEVTPDSVRAWCAEGRHELRQAGGPAVQTEAQILQALQRHAPKLRHTAERVYGAWLRQWAQPALPALAWGG